MCIVVLMFELVFKLTVKHVALIYPVRRNMHMYMYSRKAKQHQKASKMQ